MKTMILNGDYEELKEISDLSSGSIPGRKIEEEWIGKYRHVARKLVLERGWMQTRLNKHGTDGRKNVKVCLKEEDTEKYSSTIVQI